MGDIGALQAHLESVRAGGGGRMLSMRGRRQVGKSALLTRFTEAGAMPSLYFSAVKKAPPAVQLEHLRRDALTSTSPLPDTATLFASVPASWADAFARIALACRDTPAVVVLDEFPWAAETDPTLEGVLQNAWDRELQHRPVLLVLVGSDVAVMERLLAHDRPLFGRAREFALGPFGPAECAAALDGRGAVEIFDTYLTTGGYPRLVLAARDYPDHRRFVAAQLADDTSDLVVVGQRAVEAEFPVDAQARTVLSVIGSAEIGVASFSTVAARLAGEGTAPQTAVTRALRILVDQTRVVAVDTPAGAAPSTRLRRYRIADPYLRFWFRFVEDQVANISRGRADIAVGAFNEAWTTYRGKAIEPVVTEAVSRLAPELAALDGVDRVGGWWNRQHSPEYDIVALAGPTVQAVGSIKWRERTRFNAGELARLATARTTLPNADTAALIVVCPAGLRTGLTADLVLSPTDLLAAWPT
jgi:hypothetical protein